MIQIPLEIVLRELYESDINGEVAWDADRGWYGKIGCSERGWVAKCEASYLDGLADSLVQLALSSYPNSDFAEKYRPPPQEEKPGVTVRRGRRGAIG